MNKAIRSALLTAKSVRPSQLGRHKFQDGGSLPNDAQDETAGFTSDEQVPDYRPLNYDKLAAAGAVRTTLQGKDPDNYNPDPKAGFSLVSGWNDGFGQHPLNWPNHPSEEVQKTVRNIFSDNPEYIAPHKYRQIIYSAKKLGVPEEDIYLSKKASGGEVRKHFDDGGAADENASRRVQAAQPVVNDTAAADASSQTAGYNPSDQNVSAVTDQSKDSSNVPIYLQPFDFSKYDNTAAAGMAYYSQFMPTAGAAIMMGNGAVESYNPNTKIGFDPSVKQVGGGPGNGFFQWGSDPESGRWTNDTGNPKTMGLVQFAQTYGFDPNSAEAQFRFPLYEMTVNPTYTNKGILENLQNATPDDIKSGTKSFMNDYEGAGDKSSLDRRVNQANNLLQYAQNGYSLNGLDPNVSKALNPFTQVPTTQTYAFKEPGTSNLNITGTPDTQGPNVATTGITDLKNITGSDTAFGNEETNYITSPTVTNDPFSGVMSSDLNLGNTNPLVGDTGLSTDTNQIQTNSTGITGQDIIPYGTGLDLNNGTMGVSSNGISYSPMLTNIDTGFNPAGNYSIGPGGGLGPGGFDFNMFKRGGFVDKALKVAHRAAGGQVDLPSVPVTPNKYQDLRRRMLETPAPMSGQQEDLESRKYQYLQSNPGQQIRDKSFADGGPVDDDIVSQALDVTRDAPPLTPAEIARRWTPPEESGARSPDWPEWAKDAAGNYVGNVGKAFHESGEYARQGLENTVSDKGPGYNILGPAQYALGSAGQLMSPLTGAAMSAGDAATQMTGDPTFGKKTELLAGMVDPTHIGVIKNATRIAHDVAPMTAIFAGPMAKTADLVALDTAKKMAATNAKPSAIIKETGWFQGADGKWRFEIPDVKSKITDQVFNNIKEKGIHEGTLPAALEHPELYTAYPQLNEMQATFGASAKPRGSYSPWTKDITVEGPSVASQRSTALHEAQHAVQQIEGFARGADNIFLKPNTPAWDIYQERLKAIKTPMTVEEFEKAGIGSPEYTYSEYLKQTKDSIKNNAPMLDRAAQDYAVQEAYRRSAGEAEARNVQARRNMEPSELQSKEPWTTQSIPNEEQIVQFHNTEPQMSVGPSSVETAQNIADLLRKGQEKKITDEMFAKADPQTLWELYHSGATGMEMPMDFESRMARAKAMGYDQKAYRGIRNEEVNDYKLNTNRPEGKMEGTGSWLSSDPDVAATYTGNKSESPATLPVLVQSKELKTVPWKGEVWSYGPEGKSTDEVGRAVRNVGAKGVNFTDIVDIGPHLWNRVDNQKRLPETSTTTMVSDPSIVRSQFAIFDPRLSHLTHLNRKDGGTIPFGSDAARNALEIPKQKTSASNNYADGGSTDYQSTGDVVMPDTGIPNWGDPENKADFFRASQALLDKQKADEQAAAPKTIESRPLPAPTDKGERVDPDQTKAPTVVGTGDTVFPVVGTFSGGPRSYYGAERPSLSGYMRLHAGADWQASNGSGVYAPVDGKVVYSGQHSGYGNMVDVLGNDGYVRRFAVHDGDVLVKPGDAVSAGQQIGTVGGQHLHHEVLKPDSSAATLAIKGQFGQTSRVGGRDEQTLDPSSFYKLKSGTKVYGPAGLTPPAARKDGGRVGHITYNLDPDIHGRKHSGYSKEGGRITWMSPEEFLAKVPQKLRLDRKSEKTVEHFKDKIKKGKKLNPLAIFPNNGGQDGRHRAMAAKELGIKKVPVIQWPPGHTVVSRALMLTSKKA